MKETELSDAAKRFLIDEIGPVERLDVLLFLHKHAIRWWGAQALAAELDMPETSAQLHLDHLSARNLLDVRIAESVVYRYSPGREDLAQLVEEIARVHYLQRDAIVAMVAHRRTGSARLFADAFQFWKGKQDG
jgi:predicted ArsR family transcriptional regulator